MLHSLVLIALLVGLQFEQVREILGALTTTATAATTTATAALLHLYVAVHRLRALQSLQRLLLGRERIAATHAPQLFFGGLEFGHGLRELVLDLRERRIARRHATLGETLHELRHIGLQPTFGDRQRRHVLAALLVRRAHAVAQPVERARDHFLLARREAIG